MKKLFIYIILGISSLILVVLISGIQFRYFKGMSVEEVITRKYNCNFYRYIESEKYYAIDVIGEHDSEEFEEFLYKDKEGRYHSIYDGFRLEIKEATKNVVSQEDNGFAIYAKVFMHEGNYVILLKKNDTYQHYNIYDNEGKWEYIVDGNNSYYFNVVTDLDNSYKVFAETKNDSFYILGTEELINEFGTK